MSLENRRITAVKSKEEIEEISLVLARKQRLVNRQDTRQETKKQGCKRNGARVGDMYCSREGYL